MSDTLVTKPCYATCVATYGAEGHSSFRPTRGKEGAGKMVRSVVKKVMWVGRATVFVVGLSVILAVVLGVATTAAAHSGSAGLFHLNHNNNVTTALTKLTGTLAGSVLKVDNNGAGPALSLEADSGRAPLTVNATAGKATNLNADKLDGKTITEVGVAGLEEIEQRFTVDANTSFAGFHLPCPSGKQALGGGFGVEAFNPNIRVNTSLPSGGTGTGWSVVASNSGTTESFIDIKVICAVVQ